MLNNPLNFSLVANNDIVIRMSAKNADGTPRDITGYAIKWSARKNASTSPAVTKSTAGATITITNAAQGTFQFKILAADTKDLAEGDYIHEAVTVDPSGNAVTIANNDAKLTAGKMFLRAEYTVQD